ncbi:MAG: hypothetical protein ACJ77M_10745 [Thermoleophilaceae bacterium]
MWNPLTLPGLMVGTATEVLRALAALPGVVAALEQRLATLDVLIEQGNAVVAELQGVRQALERDVLAIAERIGKLEPAQRELEEITRRLEQLLDQPRQPVQPAAPVEPEPARKGRFGAAFRRSPSTQA